MHLCAGLNDRTLNSLLILTRSRIDELLNKTIIEKGEKWRVNCRD